MAIVASKPMMATTIMISMSVKPRMGAFLFFILNLSLKRRERDNRRVYYDYQDSFTYCRLPTAHKVNTGHVRWLRSSSALKFQTGRITLTVVPSPGRDLSFTFPRWVSTT